MLLRPTGHMGTSTCDLCGASYPTSLISVDRATGELLCPVHFRRRSLGVSPAQRKPLEEPDVPVVPKDFNTLQKLGVVRPNPANIVCTISDDRGEEVTYCGIKLSKICEEDLGVGGALSLLWFKRKLPTECTKFIELILMICADHGPAVSGAHNSIVCARAGKDVVDSLVSGLLTIGPRFGSLRLAGAGCAACSTGVECGVSCGAALAERSWFVPAIEALLRCCCAHTLD